MSFDVTVARANHQAFLETFKEKELPGIVAKSLAQIERDSKEGRGRTSITIPYEQTSFLSTFGE